MALGRSRENLQQGEGVMFMAFHTNPQRRPYLIGLFLVLLVTGLLVLALN